MNDGGGNLFYLDGAPHDRDSPVYAWYHDDPEGSEEVKSSFADWIISMLD